MNPIAFAMRRPVATMLLVVVLVSGVVLGLSMTRADSVPPPNAPAVDVYLHRIGKSAKQMKGYIAGRLESYFHKHEESHEEHTKILVTSPTVQDVIITQSFVCQIRSQRHIEVRALEGGYLNKIGIKEGQAV